MPELEEVLARLSLSQYLGRLREEGFEKWETVLDITETDLATLNFKLGHRRILQREIASARGIPPGQPLPNAHYIPPLEEHVEYEDKTSPAPSKGESNKVAATGKRKYKRHPKPDENAPEKPPSAYVMFANHVRDELKGQTLSFTDIAKLVGEKWKMLDASDKEEYELEASMAKAKYSADLAEYKKTNEYKEYLQYLAEFKKGTAKEGSEIADRKRPKLETLPQPSSSSSAETPTSSSSSTGITSTTVISNNQRPLTGSVAGRVGSISSVTTTNTSCFPSPSSQSPLTHASTLPPPHKPPNISPTSSPTPNINRYRESLRTTQEQQAESLLAHSSHDLDPISLPRIQAAVNPHIQQQLSYSRHQPPPLNASPFSRSAGPLPAPIPQALRRATEDSLSSSSGSSSATPLDDGRGSHPRALPPPTLTPQHAANIGYFDQRPHHLSPSRSPRSLSFGTPLSGPTQLVHSSSYPHPSSASSTPQPMGNDSSASSSGTVPTTGNSLPPPPPPPPSTSRSP